MKKIQISFTSKPSRIPAITWDHLFLNMKNFYQCFQQNHRSCCCFIGLIILQYHLGVGKMQFAQQQLDLVESTLSNSTLLTAIRSRTISHMQHPMLFQCTVIGFEFIWNFPSSNGIHQKMYFTWNSEGIRKWHQLKMTYQLHLLHKFSVRQTACIDNGNHPVWIILEETQDLII